MQVLFEYNDEIAIKYILASKELIRTFCNSLITNNYIKIANSNKFYINSNDPKVIISRNWKHLYTEITLIKSNNETDLYNFVLFKWKV